MSHYSHSRFPLRKCIVASVVILIVSSLVLVLLLAIANNTDSSEVGTILLIIILSITGAFLLAYWIYQIAQYIVNRHDENEKKN